MADNTEILRRRTFAIIAHPDAGKTSLTEKLLLFGGQIQVAGAVKSNKIKKTATSDWMEIEKHSGYSGAPGLCRRYLSYLDGGRQCHHRGRWSEGCGNPDPQANGSLPDAEYAGNHLCEQNGP